MAYVLSTWDLPVRLRRVSGSAQRPAEREKAAGRDPAQQRHFRFGEHGDGCGYNCLDGERANYYSSGDPYEPGTSPDTTHVGFYNGELHYKADFG